MDNNEYDGDELQCSYCGKWIYADSPRCPKCGNYTDGLGPHQYPTKNGRRIPPVFIVAACLVILAFLAPLLIALWQWLQR